MTMPSLDWIAGERALDVAPRFAPQVGGDWLKRLNYLPGRSLTAAALQAEQRQRDRRGALLCQALTPGVVTGLSVRAEPLEDDAIIHVAPGAGIGHDGEDISVEGGLRCRLSDIPPARAIADAGQPPRGLVILSLKPVRAVAAGPDSGDDPCPVDPGALAYADLTMADGACLVWSPVDITPPEGTPPARRRNLLADALLREEEAEARAGRFPAWTVHGLPICMLHVAETGAIDFLDRFSVARAGGGLETLAPSSGSVGRAALRRARFDQFVEQLQDLRAAGQDLAPGAAHFRYLPPAGVLPPGLMDFAARSLRFFPADWQLRAAPVTTGQFEALLAEAASLAPFDLSRPDMAEILVPVPDAVWEPRLLVIETVSPRFQQEIDASTADVADYTSRRDQMRFMAGAVFALVDPETVPDYGEDVPVPEVLSDGITDHRAAAMAILDALSADMAELDISDAEKELADARGLPPAGDAAAFRGLKPLAEEVQSRVGNANDVLDLSYLRMQTDIFRARKNLLGQTDAMRLSTSPVVGKIALEAETSVEAYDRVSKYFEASKASVPAVAAAAQPAEATFAMRAVAFEPAVISPLPIALAQPVGTAVSQPIGQIGATPILPLTGIFAADKIAVQTIQSSVSKIAVQNLLYGARAPYRTLTIADRLRPSPAQEAMNAARTTKAEIVRSMQKLEVHLGGLAVPSTSGSRVVLASADFQRIDGEIRAAHPNQESDGFRAWSVILAHRVAVAAPDLDAVDIDALRAALPQAELSAGAQALLSQMLAQLREEAVSLGDADAPRWIQSSAFDPEPENPDEADYFSAAVAVLESAVDILHAVEARLGSYSGWLDLMRKALVGAYTLAEAWQSEMDAIAADLEEARHDLHLAEALRDEEEARVLALNARRQDVLEKNVTILGFLRPRSADRFATAPSTPLYGEFRDPLPQCFRNNEPPPADLEAMLANLRELPLGTLAELRPLIDRLNAAERLKAVFDFARRRAGLMRGRQAVQPVQSHATGTGARLVRKTLDARQAALQQSYKARAALDLAQLAPLSWTQLRRRAWEDLSFADLLESGEGGSGLAREAWQGFERIEDVSVCLYQQFRQVPADLRLTWAEAFSVHDAPADLTRYQRLPGWGRLRPQDAITHEDWRALERMAGWILSQFDLAQDDGRSFASELIQVCLLLASHAPVAAIVEGTAARTTELKPGGLVEIDASRGVLKIGMTARFGAGGATGVIEDLSGTTARVRIAAVESIGAVLATGDAVSFAEPKAGSFAGLR
ncbi:hypothetical protein [Mangrovicoccus sp. HB161399]|uniref:hypothetical protein n=1 Tax=Mangrovicoccus sp. HB161399 TaxID=2720392 RepID=UPI001555DC1A|nr:hypothetical protein [Mangrovicoccus sp. HB161399]